MKNILITLTVLSLMYTMGCQEQEETLSGHDVLDRSIEAMEDLDSYSSQLDMTLEHEQGTDVFSVEGDVMIDPLKMHQIQEMTLEHDPHSSYETEIYLTEEGTFRYDPELDQWLTFPEDMFDEMITMENALSNPVQYMKQMQENIHDFTFTEKENEYRFTLVSDDDRFTSLVIEIIPDNLLDDEVADLLSESLRVDQIELDMTIEKETYYQTELDLQASYELGQSLSVDQHISSAYHSFDDIEEITIPEEVIENVEDMFRDDADDEDLYEENND